MPSVATLSELVRLASTEAGFDISGIAAVDRFPELDHFPEWIAAGRAGEMRYLEARSESGELKRASIEAVAPWAKSVIVCAINYNTSEPKSIDPVPDVKNPGTRGWISRYAWSKEDYHDSVLRRLRRVESALKEAAPEAETRCYVDTGPLVERIWAKYAGIGWQGKNTCLINQQSGSWLFLGVILTSLELEPSIPAPDRCGTCTRCIDACPTYAFIAPYQLDATRCISYLTIEKRGSIPEELREGIGRNVFGCDICQDVCPWNRRAPVTGAQEFSAREQLVNPALEWLAQLTEEDFREVFRRSPVKRARYNGLRRNVAVALGNSANRDAEPVLRKLAADPDPVVAEHARWGLSRLSALNEETDAASITDGFDNAAVNLRRHTPLPP